MAERSQWWKGTRIEREVELFPASAPEAKANQTARGLDGGELLVKVYMDLAKAGQFLPPAEPDTSSIKWWLPPEEVVDLRDNKDELVTEGV